MWLLLEQLLAKYGPILGPKLFNLFVKWLEHFQFKKTKDEEIVDREEHWIVPLPKLFLKKGCLINGAHFYPEMVAIINAMREHAPETTDGDIWITSAADDAPGRLPNSLHKRSRAFDFRISNLKNPADKTVWAQKAKEQLGKDYDVVLESNHIHVEYDPKEEA